MIPTTFLPDGPVDPAAILTDGRHSVTYADLPAYVARAERRVRAQHVPPEAAVAVICHQSVATGVTLLALLERQQTMVLLPPGTDAETIPPFCDYVIHSETNVDQTTSLPDALSVHVEARRGRPSSLPVVGPGKVFLRTSGSTGAAKLVMHDREKLRMNATNVWDRIAVRPADRIAVPVPLHHLYGLASAFLPAVIAGASVDLQSSPNLMRYLERERAFSPTVAFLTPPFGFTLARGRRRPRPYRITVMAGDRLPRETFDLYSEQSGCIVQVYGCTELGVMSATSPEDPVEARASTVGAPLPGVELRLDDDSGQLLCRHAYGSDSYADEFGTAIPRDEWFPTRDLVEFDECGRVRVLGRCDQQVKRDGFWVCLPDIEAALIRISDVQAAAVVVAGDTLRGVGLVAFCEVGNPSVTPEMLREACLPLLPTRAIPDAIEVVSKLPELESGKIDRRTLQARALATLAIARDRVSRP